MQATHGSAHGPSLFLSYSHRDRELVRRIAADLTERGVRVWLDEATLFVGDQLAERIRSAIAEVDCVAVVLSHKSVQSTWVRDEIAMAVAEEERAGRDKLVVLRLDDCAEPQGLDGRQIIEFTSPDAYEGSIHLLAERLRASAAPGGETGRQGAQWPLPTEAFAPVRWLRLHVVFYDGTDFVGGPGRIAMNDDTRVEELPTRRTAQFFGLDYEPQVLEEARLAHYEAREWLRRRLTLADEGVKSGDHIIVVLGAGASKAIEEVINDYVRGQKG